MQDFYLKFADEAECNSVLYTTTEEVVDEDGKIVQEAQTKPNYQNIDVIGVLFDNTDQENPVEIPGWHVNVRVVNDENTVVLEPFAVFPVAPRRVWA